MPCATNPRRRAARRAYNGVRGVRCGPRVATLREISTVLIRYGFGDIVRGAGVSTLLERAGQVLQWDRPPKSLISNRSSARLALEQLGPTFVKLGQILSTREDLLPPAWTEELNKLFSKVAPVPFDDLLPQVDRRSAALRSRCLPVWSASRTPPPRLPRYIGPRSPAARRSS